MDQRGAYTLSIDTSGLPINENPLKYRVIVEGDPDSLLPPVLLIHGSPGAAIGFEQFTPLLAESGRQVITYDLPGFASQAEPRSRGSIYENYSAAAFAELAWRMLDSMGIKGQVHLVGWSNGGAVALRMIEDDADRVASLTLLASVGPQHTEGTGSYIFEHFKYKAGQALLVHGAKLIPHFGALGPASERHAFLRFFDDTDQRDFATLMEKIDTPTMIMHGRHDFLIAARAAEEHHRLMPTSRLVMLDAMHFIPMLHPHRGSEYLNPFFARHDTPGVAPETGVVDLAPVPDRSGGDAFMRIIGMGLRDLPWWIVLSGGVVLVRWRPQLGVVLVTLFVVLMDIDFGVALMAMVLGRIWWLVRGAGPLDRPWTVLGWLRGMLFVMPAFVIGIVGGAWTLVLADRLDWFGLIAGLWLTWIALITVRLVVTWEGRQRIKGWLRRCGNHEYWPTAVIYAPVLWWGFKRVITGKGLRPLTAVNPGYAPGGGVQGESKHDINTKMGDDPSVLHCDLIAAGSDRKARSQTAIERVHEDPRLGGYPVICKPDHGERGRAVKLIRDDAQLAAYCHAHQGEPVVIQRYHPGPIEVGVLWVRSLESVRDPAAHAGHSGFIYAVTIKHFPQLTGDGHHPIRRLVLAHPRHRAQARVFLERMAEVQHEVPEEGETVSLGFAGNHAQGAMFTDGHELITDALTERINTLIERFNDAQGRGFDIGRFDLRCASLEELSRGEGFGIVELNGLTSEPTNLYDPRRSIF
ncbi:MAG: alpha/beta fold hydrolase, partial [Phycisphaerales bacterium]